MQSDTEKVENLKRLTVSMLAGKDPGSAELISDPIEFHFIYGIGPDGLTPFECELENRHMGDSVELKVTGGSLPGVFGHLRPGLPGFLAELDLFYLTVAVGDVAPAASRDVIRAMAEMADCGGDCCGH